jgi:hypothetical protein
MRILMLMAATALLVPGRVLFAQDSTAVRRTVEHGVMRIPDNMMRPDEAKALGTRFVALRAIPDSASIRVGDTLSFDSIQILAVDSAGKVLGRLPIFNTRVDGKAGNLLLFRGVAGERPGLTVLTITVPRPFWFRTDLAPPATQLKVSVHE